MKFAILVNEGPYTHEASDTAYHFTEAALKAGHEIVRVFFYHDGVNNGTRLSVPPQDDRNISERWGALGQQHDLELILCVAACSTRTKPSAPARTLTTSLRASRFRGSDN